MYQITLKVDGMMCAMCETHVNDALRRGLPLKKVSSSHSRGVTTILTEEDVEQADVERVLEETGYRVLSFSKVPYEKKWSFAFWRK